ncbi:MAG: LLM class flavin-dependent oxidoreductase [Acidimicrobiaceae bacterium]|nr:LLM class flavin-dependent oxidoreductase [Acidimicrobiaceae bacterium]MBO0748425.1 LLM class flavin-dependent oxidoreductase [Acidimicrobiaceae bacterium]
MITFHWFLPTAGDSRDIVGGGHGASQVAVARRREPTIPYLTQTARAAEELGFVGALTPTGPQCEDAWVTTAMLTQTTERLKYLVAFRPGYYSPTLAAHMGASYQRQSGGRLMVNVVTGGETAEARAYGDPLGKEGRYVRTGEFLQIVGDLWAGKEVDFAGTHLRVEHASLRHLPDPVPQIYFGGSSPEAIDVAARHADVYLTWGEPPALASEKLDQVRAAAAGFGRAPRFGIRFHVITRDRSEDAWAAAHRLVEGLDPDKIAAAQAGLATSESEGQQRMRALHSGSIDNLEVHPNVWAGIGLVRGGAGTALVGSHEEVAERILEYHALGIDEFILSGYPNLEEAYWFGEGVLPLLGRLGHWQHPKERRM